MLKIMHCLSEIKTERGTLYAVFILSESGNPSHTLNLVREPSVVEGGLLRHETAEQVPAAFPPLENFKKRIKTWLLWKTDHCLFGGR